MIKPTEVYYRKYNMSNEIFLFHTKSTGFRLHSVYANTLEILLRIERMYILRNVY